MENGEQTQACQKNHYQGSSVCLLCSKTFAQQKIPGKSCRESYAASGMHFRVSGSL